MRAHEQINEGEKGAEGKEEDSLGRERSLPCPIMEGSVSCQQISFSRCSQLESTLVNSSQL